MAFDVTFYTISKKVNSTKRPTDNGTIYSCITNEDIDIMKPKIALRLALGNAPETRNYAYIEVFNRYYFVDSWTYSNSLWYANLSIDVLGTYRSQIGASTDYILRSASEYDLTIPDATYPLTSDTESRVQSIGLSPWWINSVNSGTFVVGIVCVSTTYYLFNTSQFASFLNYIYSDAYLSDLVGEENAIYFPELKTRVNPLQFISSVQWNPYNGSLGGESVTTVRIGYAEIPVSARKISDNAIVRYDKFITLERHPQASRGKYLNTKPYSSYTLFFPPWGMIELDSDLIANTSELYIRWTMDVRTGKGTLSVFNDDLEQLTWIHSQISVPYQISQVLTSSTGISGIVQPVASLISGNVLGSITGAIGSIGNALSGKVPSAKTLGSDGSINSLDGLPCIYYEFKTIVEEDLSNRGRPLCKKRRIDSLSGYILCSDAHTSISGATKNEQDMINQFMEGGFYYE